MNFKFEQWGVIIASWVEIYTDTELNRQNKWLIDKMYTYIYVNYLLEVSSLYDSQANPKPLDLDTFFLS